MNVQLIEKTEALKVSNQTFCSAIIVAAGKSRRMESMVNKVYIDLNGKKAIIRTLEAFQESSMINEIMLVVNEKDIEYCKSKVIDFSVFTKIKKIIQGGITRQESVHNGLKEISKQSELVLIHDGARVMISQDIIERSIEGAMNYGAVSTGMPVKDTIKVTDKNGFVINTPERSTLWAVQTPQTFKKDIILEAHKRAEELAIKATDDAALVESLGYKLKLIEGSYENIKLTTPEDVVVARALIEDRDSI